MPAKLKEAPGGLHIRAFLVLLAALAIPPFAEAACSLSSSSISFGSYDVFSPNHLDSIGEMVFRCAPNDKNVAISLSRGGAASFSPRRLVNVGSFINYNLYLDAARSVVWGDGSGGTQTYFVSNPKPNNADIAVPVYGRISAGQSAAAFGNYSDTITAVINY
jgi:spore coat protein U-like protein